MLGKRMLSAAVLIPIVIAAVIIGQWTLAILVVVLACVSAWEYWKMFKAGGYRPSMLLVIIGTVGILAVRFFFKADIFLVALGLLVLMTIGWHTFNYERGVETSATDFGITLAGMIYIGFLGSFIAALRGIDPGGLWWTALSLLSIAIADSAAYFVGKAFGKHKMMPRVSPQKSWEGYLGGILISILLISLAAFFVTKVQVQITWWKGSILAAVISILAPLGDFAESMLKRQCHIKDSSNLIPGHGGVFDRIDSYLWTGILAYYLITIFF